MSHRNIECDTQPLAHLVYPVPPHTLSSHTTCTYPPPATASFHAYYDTADAMETWDMLSDYATTGQYIVVYPQGSQDNIHNETLPYPDPYKGYRLV